MGKTQTENKAEIKKAETQKENAAEFKDGATAVVDKPISSDEKENKSGSGKETDEEVIEPKVTTLKSNFAKVQLNNFRGSYKDAFFNDDGVCSRISKDTLEALKRDFPGINVTEFQIID